MFSTIVESTTDMTSIENQMNITVVFPNATLPTPTNGGFKNQEEFRTFIMEHQNGKWKTEFTSRPTAEREHDYINDTLGDAFPLQFPHGHTCLKGRSGHNRAQREDIRTTN